jgi:hypothetical protein
VFFQGGDIKKHSILVSFNIIKKNKRRGKMKARYVISLILAFALVFIGMSTANAWTPSPGKDDPLVRWPGTQPEQGVNLEGSNRCLNCHADYSTVGEPGDWIGSMMAQAARDPMWFACMTVAAQDAIWAVGNPNAVDICIRCHTPAGWLGGRSDPTNASALTGDDFDGLSCDFCHSMWDPLYETATMMPEEGNDWVGYWDEATTLSQDEAAITGQEDAILSQDITLFTGQPFFTKHGEPKYALTYTEAASGQYFVSPGGQKRAGFVDAAARHQMLYSRFHKSKYFCATCHDVSNPVLANLGLSGLPDQSGGVDQITEQYSAGMYFHVERTWSEFMLSEYSQMGGAPTNPEFAAASGITHVAKCQDCHMFDVTERGGNKHGAPIRPDESTEHPNSGMPKHDLTGGNAWISYILGTLDPDVPEYDPVNVSILDQGPDILTLDLSAGETPVNNGAKLIDGSNRAKDQLRLAATIKNYAYDMNTGSLSFTVQNNTPHKLISGFPEGRRMFVNVKAYDAGMNLIYEVNPYDHDICGNLKGLDSHYCSEPLGANEVYIDDLVYEAHTSSTLTGEAHTLHFVLADGRSKDNRILPRGFDLGSSPARHSEPVPANHFTASEAAGGYDDVSISIAPGAATVEIVLYYQGTSRDYIEFLRDEINGGPHTTLTGTGAGGDPPYIAQTDPFFDKLRAWGNAIWDLWWHNHGLDGSGKAVEGIVPFAMEVVTIGGMQQELLCFDGQDNDGDGLTDCADPDCDGFVDGACTTGDGCAGTRTCSGGGEICVKDDPTCPGGMACSDYIDKGLCNNDPNCEWIGNPNTGYCQDVAGCTPTSPDEVGLCDDGIDNDCDGMTDCADTADCGADPVCQVMDCTQYTTQTDCETYPECRWRRKQMECVNR